MAGFFERILGRGRNTKSAQTAKQRLQFVLVHDRINLPPEKIKAMKEEILAVISKYVNVASNDVDIALEQRDRNSNMLVAEVPFSTSVPDQVRRDIDENTDLADAPEISSTDVATDVATEAADDDTATDSDERVMVSDEETVKVKPVTDAEGDSADAEADTKNSGS